MVIWQTVRRCATTHDAKLDLMVATGEMIIYHQQFLAQIPKLPKQLLVDERDKQLDYRLSLP